MEQDVRVEDRNHALFGSELRAHPFDLLEKCRKPRNLQRGLLSQHLTPANDTAPAEVPEAVGIQALIGHVGEPIPELPANAMRSEGRILQSNISIP